MRFPNGSSTWTRRQPGSGAGGRAGQTFGCLILQVGDDAEVGHTAAVTRTRAGSVRLDSFVADLGHRARLDSFALIDGKGLTRRQYARMASTLVLSGARDAVEALAGAPA